ncbi:hypothetical protein IWX78_000625 [Mycetocola sp. CAN_C7]|uniref:hypothetical protein n=1 Tax=Mycetocola sp. CAN_C7 TaxID=2787724 RepID=UPI0018C9C19D
MTQARSITRFAASVAAALIILGAGVSPAVALQDPGRPANGSTPSLSCTLERIGTQLVRCDDFTGAGSEAPSHIPEQR